MAKFSPSLEQQVNFINEIAPLAQKAFLTLGKVYPSICIGMACIESGYGWGTDGTRLMYKYNAVLGQKVGTGKTATKYWGGKAFKASTKEEYQVGIHTTIPTAAFREYDNLEQCIFNYYELLNTSLYKKVLSTADYKTQMAQIKQCGYMTSSTEVDSVLRVIKTHNLTRFDNGMPVSVSTNSTAPYVIGKTYTTESDLYIRDNANGNKVKFECITLDAKAHSKFDDFGYAILKSGTRVTCKNFIILDNSTWVQIPSGWICAKNKSTTYIK